MSRPRFTWTISIAIAASFASSQVVAQTAAEPSDASICATISGGTVEACTRLIEQEFRESTRRRAVMLTYRAAALKVKGDIERAVRDLTEAISLAPEMADIYEARGDLQRDRDQCGTAVTDYGEAIKLLPERAINYISRGLCLSSMNETDRALADFDKAISLDSNNAQGLEVVGLGMKGRLYAKTKNFDHALEYYDNAIKRDGKRAILYIERGTAWADKGDREKAVADYDEAIKLDPANLEGYATVAHVLKSNVHAMKENNLDAAIADYDAAIKLAPRDAALLFGRAALWSRKNANERALSDYDQAIKLDPNSAPAYSKRGDFHRARGDDRQALADYNAAISKQRDYTPAHGSRALLHFYKAEFEAAAADFKHVVEKEPTAYSMLLLYLSQAREGNGREARTELTRVAPKLNANAWPQPLVELYLGRKSLQATEPMATKPEQKCEAQFYIGEWQLVRGARQAAMKAFQTAVDTCPKDFVEYRGAIEELKRLR